MSVQHANMMYENSASSYTAIVRRRLNGWHDIEESLRFFELRLNRAISEENPQVIASVRV